jgi:hypothetical protein
LPASWMVCTTRTQTGERLSRYRDHRTLKGPCALRPGRPTVLDALMGGLIGQGGGRCRRGLAWAPRSKWIWPVCFDFLRLKRKRYSSR